MYLRSIIKKNNLVFNFLRMKVLVSYAVVLLKNIQLVLMMFFIPWKTRNLDNRSLRLLQVVLKEFVPFASTFQDVCISEKKQNQIYLRFTLQGHLLARYLHSTLLGRCYITTGSCLYGGTHQLQSDCMMWLLSPAGRE